MHIFNSRTGLFRFSDGTCAIAYSGHGDGINNPSLEAIRGVGPIPVGLWDIMNPHDSSVTGPYSLPLVPVEHDAHGRTLFRIHGDNRKGDKSASHGCIIMSPLCLRRKIYQSGVHRLEVVAG